MKIFAVLLGLLLPGVLEAQSYQQICTPNANGGCNPVNSGNPLPTTGSSATNPSFTVPAPVNPNGFDGQSTIQTAGTPQSFWSGATAIKGARIVPALNAATDATGAALYYNDKDGTASCSQSGANMPLAPGQPHTFPPLNSGQSIWICAPNVVSYSGEVYK